MIKRAILLLSILSFISCSKKDPVGDWEIEAIYDHEGLEEQVSNMTKDQKLRRIEEIELVDGVLSETVIGKIIENNKKNIEGEDLDNLVRHTYMEMFSVKTRNSFISIREDKTFNYYIDPYYFEGNWEKKDENTVILNITNNDFYSNPIELELNHDDDLYSFKNLTHDKTTLWVYDRVSAIESSGVPKHRLPENNLWRNKDLEVKAKVKNLLKFWIYVCDDLIMNEKPLNISSKYYLCPFRFYSIGLTVYSTDNDRIRPWQTTFNNQEEFEEAHQLLVSVLKKADFPTEKGLSKMERNLKFFKDAYSKI